MASHRRKSPKLLHHHKLDLTPVVSMEIREIVHDAAPDHCPIAVPEIQIDIGKPEHRVVFSNRPSSSESRASSGNDMASFGGGGSMPEVCHLGWVRWYALRELEAATNGLSDENVIGEGGYGIVYSGVLADSTRVAVKNLLNDSAREQNLISCKAFHIIFFSLISTLSGLLQVKYQSQNCSPFDDAHFITIVAFIVAVLLYVIASAAEITQYTSYRKVLGHTGLFSGALASILLLLVLIPIFGWSLLILWGIIFVRVLHNSIIELAYKRLFNVLQMLMNHNSREQPDRIPV